MMAVWTDLTLVQGILAIGLGASTFCYLLGIYSAEQFFRRRDRKREGQPLPRQGISVLKPLKGPDVDLYENLASLCAQQYAPLQILCGVADKNDEAISVVRQLMLDFPAVDIQLVVDPRVYGANYKVSNLIHLYRRAVHDVIVIADSDIRVGPTYLDSINRAVSDPEVGLATCVYRAVNRGPAPSMVEALFINTDFTPLVMVARKVEKSTYAFGATIAMRRAVLDEIGGFAPLVNALADDYQLGNRVAARGYRLELLDEVVDTVLSINNWRRLFDHQLRWARTYRICRPGGYAASVITHGTLWALLNVLYHWFSPTALAVSASVMAIRYASATAMSWRYLNTAAGWRELAALPCKDLLFDVVWLLAFAGNTVVWGGVRFRVDSDGEMTEFKARRPLADAIADVRETGASDDRLPQRFERN